MPRVSQRRHRVTPPAVALLLVLSIASGCSVEQILIGQWYSIQTPAAGACPRLGWHFVVDSQRSIAGTLSAPGQWQIATLTGTLQPDDSFQMTATGTNGEQSAVVTGRFTSDVTTIAIRGNVPGIDCNGHVFTERLGRYFSYQGGGGGGGG